ncbi:hypothetical protein KZ829_00350 [Actinoplanes hulinensis]|uniref:Uncharacterized protein n=1 Tax=Actinoplanes hulinensis TaxID=1144547 RepID=A0ABS7ATR2_9ACTN|nr:hypothetical protein [Actinoplanes hulinensis]MBW6432196.1 hypothetical protein [Actinoplanes hulinensis]
MIKRFDALGMDDTVWLEPRTLGCHRICYLRPSGKVKSTAEWPFVIVEIRGVRYRVHADNLCQSNPAARQTERKSPRRLTLPDGFEEQPLF